MDNNSQKVLMDLREILLSQSEHYQALSKTLVATAKDTIQQFNAAKTIGIVQGYLESIRTIDGLL